MKNAELFLHHEDDGKHELTVSTKKGDFRDPHPNTVMVTLWSGRRVFRFEAIAKGGSFIDRPYVDVHEQDGPFDYERDD